MDQEYTTDKPKAKESEEVDPNTLGDEVFQEE